MKSRGSRQEILSELQEAVVEFNTNLVCGTAQRTLSEGLDAYDAIANGLAAGMECAGELYACGEYFLPGLFMHPFVGMPTSCAFRRR